MIDPDIAPGQEEDKEMEKAQEDAAGEREENGGYQLRPTPDGERAVCIGGRALPSGTTRCRCRAGGCADAGALHADDAQFSPAVLVMIPTAALAADQTLPSGQWGITSTTVEMSVPGLPGFAARMMRGKSKTERKRLSEGQGVSELIAPDPKAGCRIDGQQVTNGRYEQTLSCPQKRGEPIHVVRIGNYDRSGFAGRATVTGITPKGAMRIVLDQRAARLRN